MSEAVEVAQLGDKNRGRRELEAAQTHQGLDRWVHPPLRDLHGDQFLQSRDALGGLGVRHR